jgi:hypothetical protein
VTTFRCRLPSDGLPQGIAERLHQVPQFASFLRSGAHTLGVDRKGIETGLQGFRKQDKQFSLRRTSPEVDVIDAPVPPDGPSRLHVGPIAVDDDGPQLRLAESAVGVGSGDGRAVLSLAPGLDADEPAACVQQSQACKLADGAQVRLAIGMGRELGVEDGPGMSSRPRRVQQDVPFVLAEPCAAKTIDGSGGFSALGARETVSDLLER